MNKKIVVYGASWCGPCRQAKAWLDQKGYNYIYIDVDENPELMPEGYRTIPVIQVDDDYFSGLVKAAAAIAD